MRIALGCNGYNGFRMIDDLDEFSHADPGEKLVLCGSRALFQGIDIPALDFVCLNRIPFPNWNDKARAQQDYLTNNGKNGFDPWKGFVVPKTQNDILQSSGRLWRDVSSKGVVSIFDDRIEKHRYMIKRCFDQYRHGIAINIRREPNGEIESFI
jgi:Rad3-related DNA helicase